MTALLGLQSTGTTEETTAGASATAVPPALVQDNIDAALAAIEALQANAQAFIDEVTAVVGSAPEDPQAAIQALQAALTDEVGALQSVALAQALSLAAAVTQPTCFALGQLSMATRVVPYPLNNYSIFGPLAGAVRDLDNGVSDALYNFYVQAFTTLLAPVTLPPGTEAIQPYITLAQTLLALLAINWHSEYTPAGGGDPVVRDTPAFLNLPMIFDVDGRTGLDACGYMGLNLATGDITETVGRLPGSDLNIQLDIKSEVLGGVISAGYETKGYKSPAIFDTVQSLTGTLANTKLRLPGQVFTQILNLTSAIQFRWESAGAPRSYHFGSKVPGGETSGGSQVNYSAPTEGGSFAYTLRLPTAGPINLTLKHTPSATNFEWCTSNKGHCSNETATQRAAETQSMHFYASRVILVDQVGTIGAGPPATTCPAFAVLGDAHLMGKRFFLGAAPLRPTGHAYVDTNDQPISGCLATASTTGTLPAGFKALKRRTTWSGAGLTPPIATKTGTINCPPTTAITGGAFGISFGLSRYLCTFVPTNVTLPTISGTTTVGSVLTSTTGTWTPTTAPNAPTFTRQWRRCNTSGGSCANITGQTGTTYTLAAADLGRTIRVVVTASNFDGSNSATSAQTAIIT
jgi:hypothetical protein